MSTEGSGEGLNYILRANGDNPTVVSANEHELRFHVKSYRDRVAGDHVELYQRPLNMKERIEAGEEVPLFYADEGWEYEIDRLIRKLDMGDEIRREFGPAFEDSYARG